jgi:hypothetical protein
VIRSDQLAAAFDVLARHEIRKREHPPADAIPCFDDRHLVSGTLQLIGRGQAAEPAANHHHPAGPGQQRAGEPLGHEERRPRRERPLQHLAASEA